MHDGVDPVFGEDAAQGAAVVDIDPIEADGFSADLLDARDGFFAGVGQIVRDHGLVARGQKLHGAVRADVARAAGK